MEQEATGRVRNGGGTPTWGILDQALASPLATPLGSGRASLSEPRHAFLWVLSFTQTKGLALLLDTPTSLFLLGVHLLFPS